LQLIAACSLAPAVYTIYLARRKQESEDALLPPLGPLASWSSVDCASSEPVAGRGARGSRTPPCARAAMAAAAAPGTAAASPPAASPSPSPSPSLSPSPSPPPAAASTAAPGSPLAFVRAESAGGADLLEAFGLRDLLETFRKRLSRNTLRTTFLHYVTDLPVEVDGPRAGAPIRPRCRAGSLMEIARAPANEDVRVLEEFDERVLRGALTLREGAKVEMPAWLEVEQKMGVDDRRRRKERERERRRKKKKRKSGKRKRDGEEEAATGGDGDGGKGKKKKKRRKDADTASAAAV
jgi:hypothetical protein